MRKTGWTKKAVLFLILGCLMLGGCTFVKKETVKLRDLDFTVLSEEKIPEELKKKIEEVKKEPFQFTFEEKDGLYICIGYGQQERSGYRHCGKRTVSDGWGYPGQHKSSGTGNTEAGE